MTIPTAIRRLPLLLAMAMTAAALSGCGAIAENVTENVAERVVEAEGGGDVDIDLDDGDGGISFESSEGSFRIGTQEMPKDFPSRIPLPADATPVSSMATDSADGASYNLSLTTDADDPGALADDLESRVTDAGFTIDGTSSMGSGGELVRTFQFSDAEWQGNVIVTSDAESGTVANYTVVTASD